MAHVANSIGSSPQGIMSNSFSTSPSSSNTLVSPSIVEAIDRIFPKSPSQLLPQSLSESFCNKSSINSSIASTTNTTVASASFTNMTSSIGTKTCLSGSFSNVSSLNSSITSTNAFPSACVTTCTTTVASANFANMTSSNGKSVMSLTPSQESPLAMSVSNGNSISGISSSKKSGGAVDDICFKSPQKASNDFITPIRISKADRDIINNLNFDNLLKNGKTRHPKMSPSKLSDSGPKDASDSDDMCRPFIRYKKEKKKKKRKRSENDATILDYCDSSDLSTREDVTPNSSFPLSPSEDSSSLTNTVQISNNTDLHLSTSVAPNQELQYSLDSSAAPLLPSSDIEIISAYSMRTDHQKLPKGKRSRVHAQKDIKYINKYFLPCFIVLQNVNNKLPLACGTADSNIDLKLTLKERVTKLARLCAEDKIECPLNLKEITAHSHINEILDFRGIDDVIGNFSEDDFREPRGRSLRKRRSDISYVEPSEYDIIDDLSFGPKKKKSKKDKLDGIENKIQEMDTVEKNSSSSVQENFDTSLKEILTTKDSDSLLPKKKKRKKKSSEVSKDTVHASHGTIVTNVTDKKAGSVQNPSNLDVEKTNISINDNSNNLTTHVPVTKNLGQNVVIVFPKASISSSIPSSSERNSVSTSSTKSNVCETGKENLSTSRGQKTTTVPKTKSSENQVYVYPPTTTTSSLAVTTVSTMSKRRSRSRKSHSDNVRIFTAASASPNILTNPSALASSSTIPVEIPGSYLPTNAASLVPVNLPPGAINSMPGLVPLSGTNAHPPNMCMVKIDGKDYLVAMPPGQSSGIGTLPIRAPIRPDLVVHGNPPRRMLVPVTNATRYMLCQPGGTMIPAFQPVNLSTICGTVSSNTPSLASSSLSSRLSSSITLPGITNSSLPLNAIASSITSVTQHPISSTASPVIISSIRSPLVSIAAPPPPPSIASALLSTSSMVSASATATSSASSTSTVQLVMPATNPSVSGARCFRIIVPACGTAGSSARIATLGTSIAAMSSSPLTRLVASSSLLPQRKADPSKNLSPEKRAARRRRLEKKYPLPPGVVIKTEPLDTPSTPSVIQRSLLSAQNIQLIAAASRSGATGLQRFRIIAPGGAPRGLMVGSTPIRIGSNLFFRAPVVSSSSAATSKTTSATSVVTSFTTTVSVTNSSTTLTTSTTAVTPSGTLTVSSTLPTSTPADITSSSASTSSSSTSPRGTISLLSPGNFQFPTSSATGASLLASSNINIVHRPSANTTTSSQSSFTEPLLQSSAFVTNLASNERTTLIVAVEKLKKLIEAQEAMGLQGGRLDKLKELLTQKQNALFQFEQELTAEETPPTSANDVASSGDSVEFQGSSLDDPVVID